MKASHLLARVEAGQLPELLREIQVNLTARLATDEARFLAGLSATLRRQSTFLGRHPECLFQCLWNSCRLHGEDEQTCDFFDRWLQETNPQGFYWLRALAAPRELPPALPLAFRPETGLTALASLTEGRSLAGVCSEDGRMFGLDPSGDVCCWTLEGELLWRSSLEVPPRALAFSPDAGLLAAGGDAGIIFLLDSKSGELVEFLERAEGAIRKPLPGVFSLAFAPGAALVSGGFEGSLLVWDVRLCRLKRELPGHVGAVTGLALSSRGDRLASAGEDATARLWDVSTWQCLAILEHPSPVLGLNFSQDNRHLVTASDDGLRWWDATVPVPRPRGRGIPGDVKSVAFSPDGRWLGAAGGDGSLKLWDLASRDIPLAARTCFSGPEPLWSLAWSPDSRLLAAGSTTGPIRLWDRAAERESPSLLGHVNRVRVLAFSPGGDRLVSGSSDRTARLWNVQTGTLLQTFQHPSWVQGAAFAAGGGCLTTCRDGLARLWDGEPGRLLEVFPVREVAPASPGAGDEFRVEQGEGEILLRGQAGEVAAFWPGALQGLIASPAGRTWAGITRGEVCILKLEDGSLARTH